MPPSCLQPTQPRSLQSAHVQSRYRRYPARQCAVAADGTRAMKDLPQGLKHATVWALIALALFIALQAWQREQMASRFTARPGVVELRRAADGHYHWPATLNGRRVEFLVDTGATGSAIPSALARELSLPQVGTMNSQTAGGATTGSIVLADLVLQGGLRVDRMRLAALPALTTPLLGMDVLGRLNLQQGAGVLRIELGPIAAVLRSRPRAHRGGGGGGVGGD